MMSDFIQDLSRVDTTLMCSAVYTGVFAGTIVAILCGIVAAL